MTARDLTNNEGVGQVIETFVIDDSTITYSSTADGGSTAVGKAVTLAGNRTIELAADADPILGKLMLVEADGAAAVITKGVVTLPGGDGATLTVNLPIVGDLGPSNAKGYVRIAASATAAEVLAARGFIEDSSTATAVVVHL